MSRDKRHLAFLLALGSLLLAYLALSPGVRSQRAAAPAPSTVASLPAADGPEQALPGGQGHRALEAPFHPVSSLPVFPLDINTASREDLMLIPGIGEKTARRIIEKRAELKGFRTVDDLTEVKWVGKVKLEKFRGLVKVGPVGDKPVDEQGQTSEQAPQ